MINKGAAMEWGSRDDGDTGECSVGLNTTLHNWFCSIQIRGSKKNQEEEEGNDGEEWGDKRKEKGWGTTESFSSRLVQNKLLIAFLSREIPLKVVLYARVVSQYEE